jgi:hypothetical protein
MCYLTPTLVIDRDAATKATAIKEILKTSGQDNRPIETNLGWILNYIKRRAVILLLKDS